MTLSPLNKRRLDNFKSNKRGWYSFLIFTFNCHVIFRVSFLFGIAIVIVIVISMFIGHLIPFPFSHLYFILSNSHFVLLQLHSMYFYFIVILFPFSSLPAEKGGMVRTSPRKFGAHTCGEPAPARRLTRGGGLLGG